MRDAMRCDASTGSKGWDWIGVFRIGGGWINSTLKVGR